MRRETHSRGFGPFITHRLRQLPDGRHVVANSRRHRKGLLPHRVPDAASAGRPCPGHASVFGHLWAPGRLAWWIVIVNLLGSVAFQISTLYAFVGPGPTDAAALHQANFFTTAGGLCFLVGSYLMIPELFDEES